MIEHWQDSLWQDASYSARCAMLDLDEAEPTYLSGAALACPRYLDGLTRTEADDLSAHALMIAMERLEATVVIQDDERRPASFIMHCFLTPAWIRELPNSHTSGHHVGGQISGLISGFLRSKRGRHSEWSTDITEVDLASVTTPSSETTVWHWPERHNLAYLTSIEEKWKTPRLANRKQTR